MGIPDHLTCLLRNVYAGQEATVRTGHGTTDWFQIGKGVPQGCTLSPCLFKLYAEYITDCESSSIFIILFYANRTPELQLGTGLQFYKEYISQSSFMSWACHMQGFYNLLGMYMGLSKSHYNIGRNDVCNFCYLSLKRKIDGMPFFHSFSRSSGWNMAFQSCISCVG